MTPAPAPSRPGPAEPVVRPPVTPVPLTAVATLVRRTDAGEEFLQDGHRIAPGDKLFMRIRGSDTMSVYVLNEDAPGDVTVLYPIRGISPANPLAPGVSYRLPGRYRDEILDWNVTSPGRRETLVAIASRHPLESFEREMAGFPRARAGQPVTYHRISRAAWSSLRGIAGLAPEPKGAGPTSLAEAVRSLRENAGTSGELWVWEVQLENP